MGLKEANSLVLYFSHAGWNFSDGTLKWLEEGNNERLVEIIKDHTNSDVFKIEAIEDYPEDYKDCCKRAKAEKENNARPGLKQYLDPFNDYKVVYLVYPNWYGTIPMPVLEQLERIENWTGKIVMPFCTHEWSGAGDSELDIKRKCVGAQVCKALAIRGCFVNSAANDVCQWIDKQLSFFDEQQ